MIDFIKAPGKVCRTCGRPVFQRIEEKWDSVRCEKVIVPLPFRIKNPSVAYPSDECEKKFVEKRGYEGKVIEIRYALFPYLCNTCNCALRAEEVMDAPEPQQTLPNPCQTGGEWQGPDAARNAG